MAKITDRIAGYTEMSAEDKLKALEALEEADNSAELERMKNAVSKANSEAAAWKKKHNELLGEEERKKQEQEDHLAQVEKELADLRKEKTVSEYAAKFLGMGYEESLAKETAQAMADGDTEKVFANQVKFNDALKKAAIADKLKSTPRPGVGSDGAIGENYAKKMDEARASGDYSALAYYTRLQAENDANGNNQ